jgi:hypothetical protein
MIGVTTGIPIVADSVDSGVTDHWYPNVADTVDSGITTYILLWQILQMVRRI